MLDLLHALTEADGIATGPLAWNEWKAGLITDLVQRTHSVLRGHEVPSQPDLATAYADLVSTPTCGPLLRINGLRTRRNSYGLRDI